MRSDNGPRIDSNVNAFEMLVGNGLLSQCRSLYDPNSQIYSTLYRSIGYLRGYGKRA